jgi:hypothetical protein
MSMQRQMPTLGQPSRTTAIHPRREPQLPSACAPIPARGPKLGAAATGTNSR